MVVFMCVWEKHHSAIQEMPFTEKTLYVSRRQYQNRHQHERQQLNSVAEQSESKIDLPAVISKTWFLMEKVIQKRFKQMKSRDCKNRTTFHFYTLDTGGLICFWMFTVLLREDLMKHSSKHWHALTSLKYFFWIRYEISLSSYNDNLFSTFDMFS